MKKQIPSIQIMNFLFKIFLIVFLINNLSASVEELRKDYSEIAIVYVSKDKLIEKSIVIAGEKFSIENIHKDPLAYAITSPNIVKEDLIYLLLRGNTRDEIPFARFIKVEGGTINSDQYGVIELALLLKLQKSESKK